MGVLTTSAMLEIKTENILVHLTIFSINKTV